MGAPVLDIELTLALIIQEILVNKLMEKLFVNLSDLIVCLEPRRWDFLASPVWVY